jgi:Co/Zn/Cd efflux system component
VTDNCCASACGSETARADPRWRRVLWFALIANGGMFLFEMVAGAAADSRALQADALDFLGDAANYAISLGVSGMALAWRARTALIKGLTILAFAVGVLVWAIMGALAGTQPDPVAMTSVGALALVTNISVALLLYRYRAGDANMRSVWVCSRNDAINNLLVIGAGFVVLWSGSGVADLVAAFIMALLGIQGGWQIIRQARNELSGGPVLS